MRNHKPLRYFINPLNSFYALAEVSLQPVQRGATPVLPLGEDARLPPPAPGSLPPLLIMVLGETARADHFALNGYARPTTPELAARGVVSLRDVWSCGTNTAASVPCMFSPLDGKVFDKREANTEGLADVLQRAGLAVLWLDNQAGGCKGVCDRVPHVDYQALQTPGLCGDDGECLDEVMLHGLQERIDQLPPERRARGVVVFMHQMGSHGPAYYKRAPAAFKKFMPECATNALQQCSREQVVNAYDNTIAYTDHFLASAIDWLQARQAQWATALLYLSDHGESLGENNLYLHGLPYRFAPDVQKHVPWITWLSPRFAQQTGITAACLERRRDERFSHDNYFHTTLGLLGVQTSVYNAARDITAGCARP
ncbi:MAG: sulfatase-like hydrolase/transferase, partial [Burkholderiaceae bacterium]|jgi:lipid A ethanolaminephosphotransferase|nr:sulfatase-like hydrolase/transferase [Burkholderiaceae bacterium]